MTINRVLMRIFTLSNQWLLNIAIFFVRIAVGSVLLVAGAGKVFGWFGGYGVDVTLQFYAAMGIPAWLGYVSMYVELLGGLLMILGFLTRFAAVAIVINMFVATIFSWSSGYLAGAAFPITLMLNALAIFIGGPMKYSLDYIFFGNSSKRK